MFFKLFKKSKDLTCLSLTLIKTNPLVLAISFFILSLFFASSDECQYSPSNSISIFLPSL